MKKIITLGLIIAAIGAFQVFDLGQYLTLDYIKSQQAALQAYYQQHTLLSIAAFFALYVLVTAASLPGAAIMTLAAGAIFGLINGVIIVSFASSIGATLAFLVSRFILRDTVQQKFGDKLAAINAGIEKDGAFYLFALRLVPAFPFFVINLVMGLTPLKTWTFYWVSQLGMFAGTVVYVNAGTQLAQLQSASGILSPKLILSFVLLAMLPFIGRKIIALIKARKAMKSFNKPKHFDTNLVVIGGGSAGLVTAYIAAAVKAKVTLIEKHKMGGDCLNTGCVPSKAIIRSAKFLSHIARSEEFGIKKARADFDFADVMQRVQSVIKKIEPHDSVERFTRLGVDVIEGEARIVSPWQVEVNGKVITTRNIVVATGARPFVPPIPGLDQVDYLTSDNLWQLREKPGKMIVLGGGPIGCELSQSFNRLGVDVTQVEMAPQIMGREDPEVSIMVLEKFKQEGVKVLVNHRAKKVVVEQGVQKLIVEHEGADIELEFDRILVAVGRAPNTAGFGLEEIGVRLTPRGTIEVDEFLQTSIPTIYACGDVAGPYQFTHTAAHQAWYSSVNSLFGIVKRFKVDYSVIPWATFTEPEVARVGLNETDAKQHNIAYEKTVYGIDDLDRAIADSEAHGFVKVLTVPGKDKILGVTIVGEHAGDLIAEYVLAMKHGLGLNKILGTIHIYPTLAEANKFAAGEWKRAHAPQKLLQWVEKFHRWRR
jgi:dihydrolipoamide dehydrogenase